DLATIHENIVIKIPMILEGLKAIKILSKKGIRTNTTLVFSPLQALLAAKAGTTFVSPFVGRLDDIHNIGMDVVGKIIKIYENYGFKTEVIVASIRNPLHIVEAAMMGADICTIPFAVMEKMAKHPLTDRGIERFLKDWEKVEK
ncbi:MAG: fructose-6-phosphate aldolase, partial [Candidatus Neomarinimicrobiota bacterium]